MTVTTCFCFVLLTVLSGVNAQTGGCQDEPCIPINDCPELLALLEQKVSQQDIGYLQKRTCGFTGSVPNVCCRKTDFQDRFTETTTARQSTTTRPRVRPASPTESMATSFEGNSYLLPGVDICGLGEERRIYGGEKTEIDEFPWMALLEYKKPVGKGFYCGGVLINSRYILTAAHCVNGKDIPKSWSLQSVRLGEYNTDTDQDCTSNERGDKDCSDPPLDVLIGEKIVHENYQPGSTDQYHDIALLRLYREVPYTDYIRPICLPGASLSSLNQHFVAGWGKTESRSESSIKLKVQIPVINNTACSAIYKKVKVTLGSGQMCAGGEKGKDSCRGDSGGSLMAVISDNNKANNWYARGIVSFGPTPCGTVGWPGVYTNVEEYMPWIISKIKP